MSAANRRLVAIFVLAAGISVSSLAAEPVCDLSAGCVGRVNVGSSIADVEAVLGRKVVLEFAGDGRFGLSVDASSEIKQLSFHIPTNPTVQAADFFLHDSPQGVIVEMISLAVACSDVGALRRFAVASGVQVGATKNGWATQLAKDSGRFVWGGDTQPICRLWVRGVGARAEVKPPRVK